MRYIFFLITKFNFIGSLSSTLSTLLALCNRPRLGISCSVLSYWESQKNDKDLYELSQTVLATPACQVSVDRAFSGLAKIYSSARTRLSAENLENILLLKLNKEIANLIDFKDFDKIAEPE